MHHPLLAVVVGHTNARRPAVAGTHYNRVASRKLSNLCPFVHQLRSFKHLQAVNFA